MIFASDVNLKSSAISPSVHLYDSDGARETAELLFKYGLTSLIDFPTMTYNRGNGYKKSSIDWILISDSISSEITALPLVPLEKRDEHIGIEFYHTPLVPKRYEVIDWDNKKARDAAVSDLKTLNQAF